MGSALMPIEGLFLLPASIQAQVIMKETRRNETATIFGRNPQERPREKDEEKT